MDRFFTKWQNQTHLPPRIREGFFEHFCPLVEGVVLVELVHLLNVIFSGKLKLPVAQPNRKLGNKKDKSQTENWEERTKETENWGKIKHQKHINDKTSKAY